MADVTNTEGQSINEAISTQVKGILKSKFSLVEEEVVLPPITKEPRIGEEPDDTAFRNEVREILPNILAQEGNVLIIQNIATQHAAATDSVFIEAGLDTYFTFIPENQSIRPQIARNSYNHPQRVISVALANEDKIKLAKANLEKDNMKGIVISIDPHADFEDENGEFDKFLPTEEKLKELGINRIVFMGEFHPKNAQFLKERRIDKKEDWDKSHIHDYMRQMNKNGIPVSFIGLDRRH